MCIRCLAESDAGRVSDLDGIGGVALRKSVVSSYRTLTVFELTRSSASCIQRTRVCQTQQVLWPVSIGGSLSLSGVGLGAALVVALPALTLPVLVSVAATVMVSFGLSLSVALADIITMPDALDAALAPDLSHVRVEILLLDTGVSRYHPGGGV